jgi:hypothetical protein
MCGIANMVIFYLLNYKIFMKAKIKTTEEPKTFKPFTIEITCETIWDARNIREAIRQTEYTPELGKLLSDIDNWIKSQGFEISPCP